MEQNASLAELQTDISKKLLSSKRLLDILDNLIEGNAQASELVVILKNNINSAFHKIEECRKIV